MNDGIYTCAFRTKDREIVAEYRCYEKEMQEQHDRMLAFRERHNCGDRLDMYTWPNGRFSHFGFKKDKRRKPPELADGWRVDAQERIVPDKRTKAGKALAEEIKAVEAGRPTNIRSRLRGMPMRASQSNHFYEAGVFFHNGAVYVHWGCPVEALDGEWGGDPLDSTTWKQLKLSEFHAAKEASEADD